MIASALKFDITCRKCGYDVELVTQSNDRMGPERRAVLKCSNPSCSTRFVLLLEMHYADIDDEGELTKCGTEGGYTDHRRLGEAPCVACALAHSHAVADRQARRRELVDA